MKNKSHNCEQQLTAELEGDEHDADVLSTPSQTNQNVPINDT